MKARKLKKIVNRKTKATLSELKAFENDLKAVEGQWGKQVIIVMYRPKY